ncbi:MAG: hypothetical protein M3Z32_10960 [Acidobacteriota bacterium]|nr:hypothetical protein [Acidobacteriota bacterium]
MNRTELESSSPGRLSSAKHVDGAELVWGYAVFVGVAVAYLDVMGAEQGHSGWSSFSASGVSGLCQNPP